LEKVSGDKQPFCLLSVSSALQPQNGRGEKAGRLDHGIIELIVAFHHDFYIIFLCIQPCARQKPLMIALNGLIQGSEQGIAIVCIEQKSIHTMA
jgi:hypothetical protein